MSGAHYARPNYGSTSRDNLTQYAAGGYGHQDEYNKEAYAGSSYPPQNGFNPARQQAKSRRKWWITGGIILALVVVGAVVGGVVGSRHSSSSSSKATGSNNAQGAANGAQSPAGGSAAGGAGTMAGAVNAEDFVSFDVNSQPIYPTSSASAAGSAPSASSSSGATCGTDPWKSSGNYQGASVPLRPNHPRLFAPAYEWACLPSKIAGDPYLQAWNATIFGNATAYAAMPVTPYVFDGGPSGSGVLDVAREVQLRIKHWAYAWRMTNDTKWVSRAWQELYAMSGNDSSVSFPSGYVPGDTWNSAHFLDVAEFSLAFAYAYDWMYDGLSAAQRSGLVGSIVSLGLSKGLTQYNNAAFWTKATGNWGCVCNGGLLNAALAILDADYSGLASTIISRATANVQVSCAQGVGADGTWQETSDYWYFGNQAAAQIGSSLITATGSDQGFFGANPSFNLSGFYHMTSMGFVEKFNWGDCGPNKYTATANGLFLYGTQFNQPMYHLYQRDRPDAPDPLSVIWYNPNVTGNWWNNLALDHYFSNNTDAWAMMRGSWTDTQQIYAGIKAGSSQGKQTHSNLDGGDFVFEALGQRWAGELCQNDYLDPGYFASELQDAQRWLYYRCRTEGQNTLLYNAAASPYYGNQIVSGVPTTTYGSTGDGQTSLGYTAPATSAAYFVADLSPQYGITVKRGMRLLNARRQMLLQDEITNGAAATQWRMHTNATVTTSNGGQTASLALGGQTLTAQLLSPSGASFTTLQPVRASTDPALPSGGSDLPNPGVTVLAVNVPSGSQTVQVLFNPQWPNFSAYKTPPSVALASWSTTSHNS